MQVDHWQSIGFFQSVLIFNTFILIIDIIHFFTNIFKYYLVNTSALSG